MKKLIAAVTLASALAVPAAPAAAEEADAWWGRKPCQWGEIGTSIWHDTPATDYEEIRLCIPRIYPEAAAATQAPSPAASDIPPPAGTKPCPAPYVGGYIVWVDTGPTGYHEEWFCIPGGP